MLETDTTRFEKFLSLLQGASLAFAIAGGSYLFLTLLPFGFFFSLIVGFFFFLLGSVFFVIFEVVQVQLDKAKEVKKQTQLLEILVHHDKTLSDY